MGRWPPHSQVVPDSEDEEDFDIGSPLTDISAKEDLPPVVPSEMSLSQPQIAVLPEASEGHQPDPTTRNSPNAGSSVPASLLIKFSTPMDDATTSARPRPRPRPRPKVVSNENADKQADTSLSIGSFSTTTPPIPNIASSSYSDPVAQFSSIPGLNHSKELDPLEPYTQDIADRAKLRRRTASAKAVPAKPANTNTDIIELSSDSDDELSFLPPQKDKGKEKEKTKAPPTRKKTKTAHDAHPVTQVDSTPADSMFGPDAVPLSHLPPSNPPLSPVPAYPEASKAVAEPSDPLDSSPMPSPPRKRKRPRALDKDEDDKRVLPDSPTFFADSSPSAPAPSAPSEPPKLSLVSGSTALSKSKARMRKILLSDDDDDWDGDAPKTKAKPKPRERKRKATHNEDEENPEVDPTPAPKRRRQAAPKKKAEVVIEVTKPRSRTHTASNSPTKKPVDPPTPSSSTRSQQPESLPVEGGEDITLDKTGSSPNSQTHQSSLSKSTGPGELTQKEAASAAKKSTSKKAKGKKRAVVSENEDEAQAPDTVAPKGKAKAAETLSPQEAEENVDKNKGSSNKTKTPNPARTADKRIASSSAMRSPSVASTHGYILPRRDSRPISEIIRKVAAQPGSPLIASPHTPLDKMRKSAFMKVVPLHPNLRPPPPRPPPPPPPKKTKKQLELEEKWEMELEETVDGWFCLTDEERKHLRQAKRDHEMGYVDD